MPRGVFRTEPRGRIVAPVKRGTVTATEADAPSGDCRAPRHAEPGTIRPAIAPLTRPVVAASYAPLSEAALSRRIRDSYTIRPVTSGETADIAGSIRPVVSPAYSGQIAGHYPPRGPAANSRRERDYPPRERNASAPVIGSAIGPAGRQYPPRNRASKSGSQWGALAATLLPGKIVADYGEPTSAPLSQLQKRPVTAPSATIPPTFGPFASALGNAWEH
jgi:hypothetical protein